jgi:AraC-like DNA-binding protein
MAQLLTELVNTRGHTTDPDVASVLHESVAGLIRQRLGQPNGISRQTRRSLHLAHIRNLIRRRLNDPTLNLEQIARTAHMSPRYLHTIFQDADLTPMQLVKRLRLEQCHHSLQDPAQLARPIRDIILTHGYRRPDQFARDFKQHFGVSATQVRKSASRHTKADHTTGKDSVPGIR